VVSLTSQSNKTQKILFPPGPASSKQRNRREKKRRRKVVIKAVTPKDHISIKLVLTGFCG
jgi:hypothetical protein